MSEDLQPGDYVQLIADCPMCFILANYRPTLWGEMFGIKLKKGDIVLIKRITGDDEFGHNSGIHIVYNQFCSGCSGYIPRDLVCKISPEQIKKARQIRRRRIIGFVTASTLLAFFRRFPMHFDTTLFQDPIVHQALTRSLAVLGYSIPGILGILALGGLSRMWNNGKLRRLAITEKQMQIRMEEERLRIVRRQEANQERYNEEREIMRTNQLRAERDLAVQRQLDDVTNTKERALGKIIAQELQGVFQVDKPPIFQYVQPQGKRAFQPGDWVRFKNPTTNNAAIYDIMNRQERKAVTGDVIQITEIHTSGNLGYKYIRDNGSLTTQQANPLDVELVS